jgi:hypothetical protein
MARTANDSWDIATSVGATAVMAALARAADLNSAISAPIPLSCRGYGEDALGRSCRPYLHNSAWSTTG